MDELNKSMEQYYGMISAADEANRSWSAEQAQKQMDFQERMSNSAHQREVEDLKKAGLNPVLSAGGAGATTGSGAMASTNGNNVDALYGLVSQAFKAQIENAKAEQASAKAMAGAAGQASSVFGDGILDSLADFVKRKTGISPEHLKEAAEAVNPYIKSIVDKGVDFVNSLVGRKSYDSVLSGFDSDSVSKNVLSSFLSASDLEPDYTAKHGYLKSKQFFKNLVNKDGSPYQASASTSDNGFSGRGGVYSSPKKKKR